MSPSKDKFRVSHALADGALVQHFQGDSSLSINRFILDPEAGQTLAGMAIGKEDCVSLLIGPEGGLSERDLTALRVARYQGLNLGPRILRTETAALAAIAAFNALYGDWR